MDVPFLELNTFVKIRNWANTGGQAKSLIRSGKIFVNGVIETRNRRKLVAGDVVRYQGADHPITADMIRS